MAAGDDTYDADCDEAFAAVASGGFSKIPQDRQHPPGDTRQDPDLDPDLDPEDRAGPAGQVPAIELRLSLHRLCLLSTCPMSPSDESARDRGPGRAGGLSLPLKRQQVMFDAFEPVDPVLESEEEDVIWGRPQPQIQPGDVDLQRT